MQTELLNEEKWQIESLEINLQKWGEFKGKYTGKIKFENNSSEAFMFNIAPDEVHSYLELLKDKLINNASNLGNRIMASLKLLPAPEVKTSIAETIAHEETKESAPIAAKDDDLPF